MLEQEAKKEGITVTDKDALDSLRETDRQEELHCPIVFPPTVIGKNQVLEFQDSEGNLVELTCPLK